MKPDSFESLLINAFEAQAKPLVSACFAPKNDKYLWLYAMGKAPDPLNFGYSGKDQISHLQKQNIATLWGTHFLESWKGNYTGPTQSAHDKILAAARTQRQQDLLEILRTTLQSLPSYHCMRAHGLKKFGLCVTPTRTIRFYYETNGRERYSQIPGLMT